MGVKLWSMESEKRCLEIQLVQLAGRSDAPWLSNFSVARIVWHNDIFLVGIEYIRCVACTGRFECFPPRRRALFTGHAVNITTGQAPILCLRWHVLETGTPARAHSSNQYRPTLLLCPCVFILPAELRFGGRIWSTPQPCSRAEKSAGVD